MDDDTFLTAFYTLTDDLYRAHFAPHKPVRPGEEPQMSDSEVLTLALLAQLHPARSEAALLRYAARHWRAYFPRLLDQSAFNRRVRDLCGVLCHLGGVIRQHLRSLRGDPAPAYFALDTVPVPLLRQCRGRRHRLFANEAALGQGGSDRARYYGVQIATLVDDDGLIAGWLSGPANTDDHWLAEAFWRWQHDPAAPPPTAAELAPVLGVSHRKGGGRDGPTGPFAPREAVGPPVDEPLLADRGFRGPRWQAHWREQYGVRVLTRAELPHAAQQLAHLRQVVERVHGWLVDASHLHFPRARSAWGLWARLGAKIAVFNLARMVNHLFHLPDFAIFSPFG